MAKTTLQLRRGTTADNATFTGAVGEVIVNTTTNSLVVHDGTTVGGFAQAPLASPAFTGTPTAPTATAGTNTTQVATTAFVTTAVANYTPSLTTTSVSEGSNQYFTKSRARSSVSATGSINYNSSTGVFSYTQPTNISAFINDVNYLTSSNVLNQLSVSDPSNSLTYNSANGVFTFVQSITSVNNQTGVIVLTTDQISQGTTNKYATTANIQSALAGGGVSNSMLANSTITVNGSTLTLGGTSTITAAAGTLTGATLNSTVLNSSLTSVGTLTSLSVSVGTGSLSNQGAITVGTQTFNDVNILASFVSNTNNYNQITIQNANAGNNASANIVAYNNAGTASANYVELGINSTTYNSTAYGIGSLNAAGYSVLASATTDLAIGTYSANAIRLQVNAATNALDSVTISSTGKTGVNNMTPTYQLDVGGDVNMTGALRMGGSAGTAGQVLITNGASKSIAVTGVASSGTTATLTFASIGYVLFSVGSAINVAGLTPVGYNGSFTVTASSTTTVTYTTSGSNLGNTGFTLGAGTVTGTIAPTWSNISSSLPNITQLDSWNRGADANYTINGGTTVFSPTNNGNAVSVTYPVQLLVHKNGVYQQPWLNNSRPVWNTLTRYGDYTVTAGQVVFTSPPQYGDIISAIVMIGNVTNPVYTTYPFTALDIATGT